MLGSETGNEYVQKIIWEIPWSRLSTNCSFKERDECEKQGGFLRHEDSKTECHPHTLMLPMGFFPGYPEDLKKKSLLSSLLLLP